MVPKHNRSWWEMVQVISILHYRKHRPLTVKIASTQITSVRASDFLPVTRRATAVNTVAVTKLDRHRFIHVQSKTWCDSERRSTQKTLEHAVANENTQQIQNVITQMSWQYRRHGDGTEDSKVHCRREDVSMSWSRSWGGQKSEFRTGQMTEGCFTRHMINKIAADIIVQYCSGWRQPTYYHGTS